MAEEEFAELAEINFSHHHQYGGHGGGVGAARWGGGAGAGMGMGAGPYTCYEAEDALRGWQGGRAGAYYSPPGTSYTIVERPSSATHLKPPPPRGTYLGTPLVPPPPPAPNRSHHASSVSSKKRPISPEQVLKLMGAGGGSKARDGADPPRRRPQSSPASPPLISELPVRTVTMVRGPPDGMGHGFGICVKGGAKDHGNRPDPSTPFHFPSPESAGGVYISRVEEGSVAERAGLRPGDTILEVNGTPFSGISHEEALKMLKSCRKMTMTVRSPTLPPPMGASTQPSWAARQQTYSWMDRSGRPVSPPHRSKEHPTRKVELSIEPGQSLGLMIRGGVEYNLGVFITGVDKDSVAERAGLMIGDQILEVNGQSFLDVTHDEAVSQLKLHKRMTLTVRDVGKVPHSCTDPPPRPWDSPGGFLGGSGRSPALQMVEEKARVVLSKSEFATLAYYQEEYAAGQMTIEAFVAVLLELLSTPEKYTLLTELREVVVPGDRGRFDELVYRREAEGRRCRPEYLVSLHSGFDSLDDPLGEPDDFRTPVSEDSGLGLGADTNGSGTRAPPPPARGHLPRPGWPPVGPYTQCDSPRDDYIEAALQDYGTLDGEKLRGRSGRRHSSPDNSLSGSLSGLQDDSFDETNMLAHTLGRSFDLKDDQELLEPDSTSLRRHHSMQRIGGGRQDMQDPSRDEEGAAMVVPDQLGNLRITVRKTKPLLGIAIEGGANTKHPLPRIINIHENGAAYEAGGLEVGQLILEVDGQKVESMHHQDVARMIAESFARRDRAEIEFLVVEAKKSNLEPKPTALIFLEG